MSKDYNSLKISTCTPRVVKTKQKCVISPAEYQSGCIFHSPPFLRFEIESNLQTDLHSPVEMTQLCLVFTSLGSLGTDF